MTSAPEIDELARRYVDLWQEQWVSMVSDPHTAEVLAKLIDLMGQQVAKMVPFLLMPFGPASTALARQESHDPASTAQPGTAAAPPGTTAAGPSSDAGTGGLAELTRRIAALEDRIARLEAERAAPGRRGRTRKPPG